MEKYGTIPPKFTKEWWDYFWEYYKKHVICVLIVMFFVLTTLYQCATKTEYDLEISFLGIGQLSDETKEKIINQISPLITETTGNDQIDVFCYQYPYSPSESLKSEVPAQQDFAMQQKYMAELNAGVCDVYIMSKSDFEASNYFSEAYTSVDEFYNKPYSDDLVIKDDNGRAYAISLRNNSIFDNTGLADNDLYIAVRNLNSSRSKKEKSVINYDNSLKVAAKLSGCE